MIQLGIVVRDQYGRLGIVCSEEPTPDQRWIDDQLNSAQIKSLGPADWWGAMPFGGGYLLAPGPLLNYVREASYEDFLTASDTANAAGRERLVKIFPNHLNRLLAERRKEAKP